MFCISFCNVFCVVHISFEELNSQFSSKKKKNLYSKVLNIFQLSLEEFVNADAIIVTYTVTDRNSFRRAVLCLTTMRNIANRQPPSSLPLGPGLRSKAVILVGNKSDLARVRVITTESKLYFSVGTYYFVRGENNINIYLS